MERSAGSCARVHYRQSTARQVAVPARHGMVPERFNNIIRNREKKHVYIYTYVHIYTHVHSNYKLLYSLIKKHQRERSPIHVCYTVRHKHYTDYEQTVRYDAPAATAM